MKNMYHVTVEFTVPVVAESEAGAEQVMADMLEGTVPKRMWGYSSECCCLSLPIDWPAEDPPFGESEGRGAGEWIRIMEERPMV